MEYCRKERSVTLRIVEVSKTRLRGAFYREKQGCKEPSVGTWDERMAGSNSRSQKVSPKAQLILGRIQRGAKLRHLGKGEKDMIKVTSILYLLINEDRLFS